MAPKKTEHSAAYLHGIGHGCKRPYVRLQGRKNEGWKKSAPKAVITAGDTEMLMLRMSHTKRMAKDSIDLMAHGSSGGAWKSWNPPGAHDRHGLHHRRQRHQGLSPEKQDEVGDRRCLQG